jgi:hypothetical protein
MMSAFNSKIQKLSYFSQEITSDFSIIYIIKAGEVVWSRNGWGFKTKYAVYSGKISKQW